MIKLIFFDIDGTLRPFETGRIPEATKAAVKRTREAGIKTAIATGRHWMEIKQENLIDDMYFDAFVTLDGEFAYAVRDTADCDSSVGAAAVRDTADCDTAVRDTADANVAGSEVYGDGTVYFDPAKGHVVQRIEIPADQVLEVIHMIEEDPFPCLFEEERAIYANMINDDLMKVLYDIKSDPPQIKPLHTAVGKKIFMMIPCMSNERAQELERRVPGCHLMRWSDGLSFDLTKKGIDKSVGIDALLDYFGYELSECAAIGDGWNDLSMISHVGLGIAMGNAKPEVIDAADYVCPHIMDDGLPAAIEHIIALNDAEK